VYVPLTGFSRISHRYSDDLNLLHFGTEKKDNIEVSAGGSVAPNVVCSLTVFNKCDNRCEVAGTALTGKTVATEV